MSDAQVLTAAQMQAAERALIDGGTTVDKLMKRAGEGAAQWVWRVAAGRDATILCGPGNNGGDGYVIGESLRRRGLSVNIVAPLGSKTDAARNARRAYGQNVLGSGKDVRGGVLVDCLFGSGLSRPLSAEHVLLLRDLAERHSTRIAVDVPSGIESDSGHLLADSLPNFDMTLALGAWKFAHWRLPVRAMMGQRKLVDIGVARVEGAAETIGRPRIHAPSHDAHKYTRGLCAIVGGAMPGASLLASLAAMRSGAGYVKLLAERSHPSAPPDLVIEGGPLDAALSDRRIDAVLIGPGLGRDDTAHTRLAAALQVGKPLVLDADALVLLCPEILPDKAQVLVTPHDGELDALCKAFSVIAGDRQARATALAKASRLTVLAKGPDSVLAAPDGRLALAPPAPSWLSVAGSGDVLAGIAVSRMAAGRNPFDAASEALWLHGRAARMLAAPFTAETLALSVGNALHDTIAH